MNSLCVTVTLVFLILGKRNSAENHTTAPNMDNARLLSLTTTTHQTQRSKLKTDFTLSTTSFVFKTISTAPSNKKRNTIGYITDSNSKFQTSIGTTHGFKAQNMKKKAEIVSAESSSTQDTTSMFNLATNTLTSSKTTILELISRTITVSTETQPPSPGSSSVTQTTTVKIVRSNSSNRYPTTGATGKQTTKILSSTLLGTILFKTSKNSSADSSTNTILSIFSTARPQISSNVTVSTPAQSFQPSTNVTPSFTINELQLKQKTTAQVGVIQTTTTKLTETSTPTTTKSTRTSINTTIKSSAHYPSHTAPNTTSTLATKSFITKSTTSTVNRSTSRQRNTSTSTVNRNLGRQHTSNTSIIAMTTEEIQSNTREHKKQLYRERLPWGVFFLAAILVVAFIILVGIVVYVVYKKYRPTKDDMDKTQLSDPETDNGISQPVTAVVGDPFTVTDGDKTMAESVERQ